MHWTWTFVWKKIINIKPVRDLYCFHENWERERERKKNRDKNNDCVGVYRILVWKKPDKKVRRTMHAFLVFTLFSSPVNQKLIYCDLHILHIIYIHCNWYSSEMIFREKTLRKFWGYKSNEHMSYQKKKSNSIQYWMYDTECAKFC